MPRIRKLPSLISRDEIGRIIDASSGTVKLLILEGAFPGFEIAGRLYARRRDVLRYKRLRDVARSQADGHVEA